MAEYTEHERRMHEINKKAIDKHQNRALKGKAKVPYPPHAGAFMGTDVDGGSAPPPKRKKGNRY